MKQNMNIFNLNGDTVTDSKVVELLDLSEDNENTPKINYELLEKARERELEEYPNNADQINAAYDKAIYYLKFKLAAKGLLHRGDNEEPMG